MKRLLNTLYVTSGNKYLSLDGENVVVLEEQKEIGRIPLHNLQAIITFGYTGASPALMGVCAQRNIDLSFMSGNGRFLARVTGEVKGNVTLRKQQYQLSENKLGLEISKELIKCKMKNQKATLTTLNKNKQLKRVFNYRSKIDEIIKQIDELSLNGDNEKQRIKIMGLEGKASNEYWMGVKYFIPKEIEFRNRTKQPTDLLNSMLNYGYAILASEITKSILVNGLDPYCGFLHFDMDRRTSLTFDLIEPFRQQIVDKTVISLINRKQITNDDLDKRNNTIKLEARKLIVSKILGKIFSTITYNDETVSYADLIRKQSKNLVDTLLNGTEFNGFYLRW